MRTWSAAQPFSRVFRTIAACCLIASASVQAQDEGPTLQLPEFSRFFVDAMSFASDSAGASRLDVYVEVPHHSLQFTKEGDLFHAGFEVNLTLYDTTEHQVADRFWRDAIDTKDYEVTTSLKMAKLSLKSFLLAPGTYTVLVQLTDTETKKTSRVKRVAVVRPYNADALSISDLMLILRLSQKGDEKVISPNIEGNVGETSDSFYVFFEAYNHRAPDTAEVRVAVRNMRGEVVSADSSRQFLPTGRKACFAKVTSSGLIAGDYSIEIRATLAASVAPPGTPVQTAFAARPCIVRWHGVPVSIVDLDVALDELQYLADGDKIDDMKKLPPDEKRNAFQEFWKKRDPSPNSERNELMEEYYSRVAYANKNFGHYMDGWKTDRGMVYIIFGSPSNIERHPFDTDAKPYEIWTYYQLDREFIFIDATGFGDYRLQSPIWDVWRTRPR